MAALGVARGRLRRALVGLRRALTARLLGHGHDVRSPKAPRGRRGVPRLRDLPSSLAQPTGLGPRSEHSRVSIGGPRPVFAYERVFGYKLRVVTTL